MYCYFSCYFRLTIRWSTFCKDEGGDPFTRKYVLILFHEKYAGSANSSFMSLIRLIATIIGISWLYVIIISQATVVGTCSCNLLNKYQSWFPPRSWMIIALDSGKESRSPRHKCMFRNIETFFKTFAQEYHKKNLPDALHVFGGKAIIHQDNSFDCGIFTIHFAERFTRDPEGCIKYLLVCRPFRVAHVIKRFTST